MSVPTFGQTCKHVTKILLREKAFWRNRCCKSRANCHYIDSDAFRLLARRMGFEQEPVEVSDRDLAAEALGHGATPSPTGFPPAEAFDGIDLDWLDREGPIRLNVPTDYAPFAQGGCGTPSGKCELYRLRLAAQAMDPLPTYTPPHEDPQTCPELAARFPLQMVSPQEPSFLNSTFANMEAMRKMAGEPSVQMHPQDARARGHHGRSVGARLQ